MCRFEQSLTESHTVCVVFIVVVYIVKDILTSCHVTMCCIVAIVMNNTT